MAVGVLHFSVIGLNGIHADTLDRELIDDESNILVNLPINLVQNANDSPQTAEDYYERAYIYRKSRQPEEALADLEQAIKLDPKSAKTYYYERALNYYELGQTGRASFDDLTDKALEDLEQVIKLDSQYAEAYCERGRIYYKLRETNKALENFDTCNELKPDALHHGYRWMRGNLYRDIGENEKAIAEYSKSIELEPNFFEAFETRASIYHDIGENEKAIADYTQVIETNQNPSSSHYDRGVLYQELGEIEKAIGDFDKVISIETSFFQPYSESGQIDRTTIERAIEDFGSNTDPSKFNPHFYEAYLNRGVIYSKLGETERALADYEQAISINPEFAEAYVERGKFYCELGNIDRSKQDWSLASDLFEQQENTPMYQEVKQLSNDSCPKSLENYPTDVVQNITNKPLKSAFAYVQRGNNYLQSGELEKALADFDEAIALRNDYADAYYYRGNVYMNLSH